MPALSKSIKFAQNFCISTVLGIKELATFFKLRLAFLVVVSAVLGYYMGTDNSYPMQLLALIVGGFLVTGASNGLNQVI